MSTLQKRLSSFNTESLPPDEMPVELLCRDKNGTYAIPFTCCRFEDEWRNYESDEKVLAQIVGWRPIEERPRFRSLKRWRKN